MVEKEKIAEALKSVVDPELHIDIWTLELVYNVTIEANKVKVTMTLTSPMCPFGPALVEEVKKKVGTIEGVESVDVDVTFHPPWEPSEELRTMLGVA